MSSYALDEYSMDDDDENLLDIGYNEHFNNT